MKNKFIYLILGLSGLLQIISISLDQYVIQKEDTIRKLENQIQTLHDKKVQITNNNHSYFHFWNQRNIEARFILDTKGIRSIDIKNQLKKINSQLDEQVNLIKRNKYLPNFEDYVIETKEIHPNAEGNELSQKTKLDLLIDNFNNDNTEEIKDGFYNYVKLAAKLYYSGLDTIKTLQEKREKKNKVVEMKFTFLVLGMLCNIGSIFFLLIFFYILIKRNKSLYSYLP